MRESSLWPEPARKTVDIHVLYFSSGVRKDYQRDSTANLRAWQGAERSSSQNADEAEAAVTNLGLAAMIGKWTPAKH